MTGKLILPPLPSLGELASALFDQRPMPDDLSTPWRLGGTLQTERPDNGTAFLFSRSAWAMQAMIRAATMRLGRAPIVWLPDYFCDDATIPMRKAGAQVQHYPICETLEPNWTVLAKMAEEHRPDIFFLVHYFGIPADGARAREFCVAVEAHLIEDASHALGPGREIGAFGDAIFYSPHKLLAIPEGSILLIRDSKSILAPEMAGGRPAPITRWLGKRLLQLLTPPSLLERRLRKQTGSFMTDATVGSRPETPALSPRAKRMLARASADLPECAMTRQANWRRIAASAASISGWSAWTPPSDDWVPYRVIMLCQSPDVASALFVRLLREGCPVESWPDLAPEVAAAPERYAVAHQLRRTLLFLPVHQTLDVDRLCHKLARCAAEL